MRRILCQEAHQEDVQEQRGLRCSPRERVNAERNKDQSSVDGPCDDQQGAHEMLARHIIIIKNSSLSLCLLARGQWVDRRDRGPGTACLALHKQTPPSRRLLVRGAQALR